MSKTMDSPKPKACRCSVCGGEIGPKERTYRVTTETTDRAGHRTSKKWGVIDEKCWARIAGSPRDVVAFLKKTAKTAQAERKRRERESATASAAAA